MPDADYPAGYLARKTISGPTLHVTYPLFFLQEGMKSSLPGVWDPVPGDDKQILINYIYQNNTHQVRN